MQQKGRKQSVHIDMGINTPITNHMSIKIKLVELNNRNGVRETNK